MVKNVLSVQESITNCRDVPRQSSFIETYLDIFKISDGEVFSLEKEF